MKALPALLAILLASPALLRGQETVLGKAGDIELTTGDAREAIAGLEASGDAPLARDPAAIGQYVRALLIQRLVLKRARDTQFDKDPEIVARLVRARETALAEAYLRANSEPPENYPSEEELRAAYETAKPTLLLPRTHRLAQIYAKDETAILALHKQVSAKGADFAAIARTSSEEKQSAAAGGEIGWLAEEQIQQAIRELLPPLKPGDISRPVRLNDGWHIIRLLETKEPRTATPEEVRPQLTARLRTERAQQLRTAFIAGILKDHPLAINEIELSKILTPAP